VNRKTLIVLGITLPIIGALVVGVFYAEAHMSANATMGLYMILMPVGLILAIVTLVRWVRLWRNSTPAYAEYRRSWWRRNP